MTRKRVWVPVRDPECPDYWCVERRELGYSGTRLRVWRREEARKLARSLNRPHRKVRP